MALHDPDCPMVNARPEDRTECVCDRTQWADPVNHTNRTIPEGEGALWETTGTGEVVRRDEARS